MMLREDKRKKFVIRVIGRELLIVTVAALLVGVWIREWNPISIVSAASPSTITVVSPNGGEYWIAGTSQTIRWKSSSVTGNVRIDLSRDGGSTWATIIANTRNDGSEPWTVTIPATTKARIRVVSLTNPAIFDISDRDFEIADPIKNIEVHPSTWTRLRGDGAIYHIFVETGVDMAKALPPPVTLSISGLPAGASETFKDKSGRPLPLFSTYMVIKTHETRTPAGRYQLQIIATSGTVRKSATITLKLVDRTETGASLVLYDSYAKSLDPNFWGNSMVAALTMYGSDYMNSFTNPFAILKKFVTDAALGKYSKAEEITKQVVTVASALKSAQMAWCLGSTNPGIDISKELGEIASLIERGNRREAISRIERLIPNLQTWLNRVNNLRVDGLIVSEVSKQTTQKLIQSAILFLDGELARLRRTTS